MENRENRVLYVRLPCNPIFPIGVVYLSDHVHKLFPDVEQRIFDVGAVPPLDYAKALERSSRRVSTDAISFLLARHSNLRTCGR